VRPRAPKRDEPGPGSKNADSSSTVAELRGIAEPTLRELRHGRFELALGRVPGVALAVLDWDFDRVVVSHGDVLETGGRERFAAAFAFL